MGKKVSTTDKIRVIDGTTHKLCSTCKEFVPVDMYSSRNASPDGLAYSCKACERKAAAKSYKKRQQKAKAQKRYQENKEEYNERAKKRYEENKEEILKQQAEWRRTPKGRAAMNEAAKRRRQRMIDQTPGGRDYTPQEIIDRDSIDGVCICQICMQPLKDDLSDLEIDHIVTIASGGADNKANVRCAHKLCNLKRPKDGSDIVG